jgi:hypothetical protein
MNDTALSASVGQAATTNATGGQPRAAEYAWYFYTQDSLDGGFD